MGLGITSETAIHDVLAETARGYSPSATVKILAHLRPIS